MAVKVAKKDRALEELRNFLGWPRMPGNEDGVYLTVEGCQHIMAMLKDGTIHTPVEVVTETPEQIAARIARRFMMLGQYTKATVEGKFKSLIVQGPPGLGKTYTIEQVLRDHDPSGINTTRVAGKMTTVQLFKQLWDHREEGQILVLDDCDSVFDDDVSLNLLKAALDSGKERWVSYFTEDNKVSEKDGSVIDKRFMFEGTVVFITNVDFDAVINSGKRLAPHFEALKSRSMYVSLGMRSRAEYMVRIGQIGKALFADRSRGCEEAVIEFMTANLDRLDEVSARMARKLSDLRETFPDFWEEMAVESCFRGA